MSEQEHIIKRVLIDLHIHESLPVSEIQAESASILKKIMIPMISNYLDSLTADGSSIRMDRWEIDLGVISMHSLEDDLKEQLERCLDVDENLIKAKQDQADTIEQQVSEDSDAEVIVYFLQTGMMPWWVKNPSSRAFTQALNALLAIRPDMLRTILLQVPDTVWLERLISTLTDEQLHRIVLSLNPEYKQLGAELYLQIARSTRMAADTGFRQAWWAEVIYINLQQGSQAYSSQGMGWLGRSAATSRPTGIFFKALAQREREIGNNLNDDGYSQLFEMYAVFAEVLVLMIENGMCQDLIGYQEQIKEIKSSIADHMPLQAGWQQSVLYIQHLWNLLGLAVGISRPAAQHQHTNSNAGVDTVPTVEKLTIEAEPGYLDTGYSQNSSYTKGEGGASPLREVIAQAGNQIDFIGDHQSAIAADEGRADDKNVERLDVQSISPFTVTERFPVSHAGLILLWPFLSHFFSALGLIDKHVFYDKQHQYKACLLLLYVALGNDLEKFEGYLPVIKILCGLTVTDWVDLQPDLTQDDMDEADHMLKAVIDHAPMWSGLSIDGLRQAYLQRAGILSVRDGNWLLQVERQNYDVLVDRLPWSNNVIKLPWLEHLIFVEWQQD